MKGDIFNHATGDIFNHATGGYLSLCVKNMPYSDEQMQILRNTVSVATNNKAVAESERDKAYKEWHDCKAKVICLSVKSKNNTLNEKEALQDAARTAYNAAVEQLTRAENANKDAQTVYDNCITQQTKLIELEKTANGDILQKPTDASTTSSTDVVSASTGSSSILSDNKFKYGAIIAGGLLVLAIGYFIVKKQKS
jgi:DNA-binding protein YbaB